jgi:hypothetical protein
MNIIAVINPTVHLIARRYPINGVVDDQDLGAPAHMIIGNIQVVRRKLPNNQ